MKNRLSLQQEINIAKIKKKLQKKLIDPINQVHLKEAKIKDIIVTQTINYFGEFKMNGKELVKGKTYFLMYESDKDLIERFFSQFKQFAILAVKEHIKDNFKSIFKKHFKKRIKNMIYYLSGNKNEFTQNFVKENCRYNITRLVTAEFFFYPNKLRGPIDNKFFLILIRKLEKVARLLPDNLHLVLGTFPVVNKKNMNNVLVYIQCGVIPIITITGKGVRSLTDPQYEINNKIESSKYFCYKFELKHYLVEQLKIISKEFKSNMYKSDVQFKNNADLVKALIVFCQMKPEYKAPKSLLSLLGLIHDYLMQHSNQSGNIDVKTEIILSSYFAQMESYIDELSCRHSKILVDNELTFLPKYALGDAATQDCNMTYGGIVECGNRGLKFATIIDICLDHRYGVAAKMFQQEMLNTKKTLHEAQIESVSQMVVSNTKSLQDECLITFSKTVTQADADKSCVVSKQITDETESVILQKEIKNKLCKFSDKMNIKFYAPRKIDRLRDDLRKKVLMHDDFMLDILSLRIYRSNRPKEVNVITDCIDKMVLEHLIDAISNIPLDYSPDDEIVVEKQVQLLESISYCMNYHFNRDDIIILLNNALRDILDYWNSPSAILFYEILDIHHTILQYDQEELKRTFQDEVLSNQEEDNQFFQTGTQEKFYTDYFKSQQSIWLQSKKKVLEVNNNQQYNMQIPHKFNF